MATKKKNKPADPDKVNKKILLYYLSSLFARKMDFLVQHDDNQWLFTNMCPEDMRVRVVSAWFVIHYLKFHNRTFSDILFKYFPALKDQPVALRLGKSKRSEGYVEYESFYGLVSAHELRQLQLFIEGTTIYMTITQISNETNELITAPQCEEEEPQTVPIGVLLFPDDIDRYTEDYRKYNDRFSTFVDYPVDPEKLTRSDVYLHPVSIDDPLDGEAVTFNFPLRDGMNCVSICEFKNKYKAEFSLTLKLRFSQRAIRAAIVFEHPEVDVISIRPNQLWFPYKKK